MVREKGVGDDVGGRGGRESGVDSASEGGGDELGGARRVGDCDELVVDLVAVSAAELQGAFVLVTRPLVSESWYRNEWKENRRDYVLGS